MKIKTQHWDTADKSNHYDAIKFVATFLVVLAHASRMYTGTGVVIPYNASDGLNHLTNIIYSFHMPLYMSVSGMVYALCIHDYQKYQDTARFLKNKAIRLLIPYLFFGICYVAPVMCLLGFTDQSYLRYCWDGIVLAHNNRHLWYIIALFEVFVVCGAVKAVAENVMPHGSHTGGKILRHPIVCVLTIVLLLAVSHESGRAPYFFSLSSCAFYLIFFYFGYCFHTQYDTVMKYLKHPAVMVICLAALVVLSEQTAWHMRMIKALFGGCFAIGATYYMPKHIMQCAWVKKQIKNGFGIYLFHPMIIYVLYVWLGQRDIQPWVLCIGIAAAAYLASDYLTRLLRRCGLGVLIGEK